MIVSELYRYPLKSGHADKLQVSEVLETGFPDDRRWVLVDSKGRFISQREQADISMIRSEIRGSGQVMFDWKGQQLTINRGNSTNAEKPIAVWSDTVTAWDMGDEAAVFFSRLTGRDVRLAEAKPHGERKVKTAYTDAHEVDYLFADSFPYLVISQESLDYLNEKLALKGQAHAPMDRFRPNIVIKDWQAHAEDAIQTIKIGASVHLRMAKPCDRCNIITIDQNTGAKSVEPLATLAQYRKLGTSKIFFGMYAWVIEGAGASIRVGDRVEVVAKN